MARWVLHGRHYPWYAPRVLWHRLSHRLAGPLLGCNCSRCFNSQWRIEYPARDNYKDRVRLAEVERQVRALTNQTELVYARGWNAGFDAAEGTGQ